ncbi:MAG TPA: phosphoribosylanthranilate isomerase [Deltaproteobacteria bacterium]|nr:phosphoribosylanthranilate isomerase [Deltaproteobacteria bacterium]
MTRVKICGMRTGEEVRLCVEAGAHALGFVTEYPADVPWNLDRDEAMRLMDLVPPFVYRVIVVGGDPDTVLSLAEYLKPQAVQLHGNEPPAVTRDIIAELSVMRIPAIKALRFSVETGRCLGTDLDPLEAGKLFESAGADALLLDSVSEKRVAGTGHSIDWTMARTIRDGLRIPVILAGGLHAGNVARAVTAVRPYAVDVISGVENPNGDKDPRKVRDFIAAAASA